MEGRELAALGYSSGTLVVLSVATAASSASPVAAVAVGSLGLGLAGTILAGVVTPRPPPAVAWAAMTARRFKLGAGLLAGTLVLSGAIGLGQWRSKANATESACSSARASLKAHMATEDYQLAREDVGEVSRSCGEDAAEEVASAGKVIAAEQPGADARRAEAEQAAATAAREQAAEENARKVAEHEAAAVSGFPDAGKVIDAMLADANKALAKADWESADERVTAAQKLLDDDYAGTSVARTKPFMALAGKVESMHKRVQPGLDALRAKQAAAAQAEAANAAVRGPEPIANGKVAVELYLKKIAHDPDSVDIQRCTAPVADGPEWVVDCAYRAKNGFGALMLDGKRFWIVRGPVEMAGQVSRMGPIQ